MTKIINIFGEPCAGKSTVASELFYKMKKEGFSVELVQEFAKELVYEQSVFLHGSQVHIFAEQQRRIDILIGKVDYVVTDSPLYLSAIYEDYGCEQGSKEFRYFVEQQFKCYDNINALVERPKKFAYNPKGRLQTEQEAQRIKHTIEMELHIRGIPYKVYQANTAATKILKSLQDI